MNQIENGLVFETERGGFMKRKMDFWVPLAISGMGMVCIIVCIALFRRYAVCPSYILTAIKYGVGMISLFAGILYLVIGIYGLICVVYFSQERKRG